MSNYFFALEVEPLTLGKVYDELPLCCIVSYSFSTSLDVKELNIDFRSALNELSAPLLYISKETFRSGSPLRFRRTKNMQRVISLISEAAPSQARGKKSVVFSDAIKPLHIEYSDLPEGLAEIAHLSTRLWLIERRLKQNAKVYHTVWNYEFKVQPNNKLAAELIAMATLDQELRTLATQDPEMWDEKVDKSNTARLKNILAKYGWPRISLVGSEASNAAWLIAQHSDHDPDFQLRCLNAMKSIPRSELRLMDMALLEDRVRISQGKPQLYGTQFDGGAKNFGPLEVEDRPNLDKRREEVGLMPFRDYMKIMKDLYKNR